MFVVGCGRHERPVDAGIRTQTLHWGNLGEPADLDPHLMTSLYEYNIGLALFEGLTRPHPETADPMPGVAERWTSQEDHTRWTFYLRPNARWSNGDPVTAHDFAFAVQRTLSPALASPYAYPLFILQNAEAYATGHETDFRRVGVEVLDEHTLRFLTRDPAPHLPKLVSHSAWFPVHRASIQRFGRMDERGTHWTRPGNLVGNGPFTLSQWTPHQVIRVTATPTYWDRASIRLREVHFHVIDTASAEEAAFRAGQLHVTTTLPTERIPVYQKDPERRAALRQQTFFATYYYRFNVRQPPLDDARVRRALAWAIDRAAIVGAGGGDHTAAYGFVPPGLSDYPGEPLFQEQLAEARQLLAAAGFPQGLGFPRLELLFNRSDNNQQIAEAVQEMWRRQLGIEVELVSKEAKVYLQDVASGAYQIARSATIGDYLDASSFLEMLTSTSGNNQTGWSHTTYDALVERARRAVGSERVTLLRDAEGILLQEMPIAPIYFYTQSTLVHPSVKGWHGNLLNVHPLHAVYLER